MTDPDLPDPTTGARSAGGADRCGGFDLGALLEQAMEMQQQLMAAQAEAAEHGGRGPGRRRRGAIVRSPAAWSSASVTHRPRGRRPRRRRPAAGPRARRAARRHGRRSRGCSRPSMGGLDLGGLGGLLGLGGMLDDGDDDRRPRRRRRRLDGRRRAVSVYAGPVQDLIDELGRLPGIGPKSAQRIAFHLLKLPKDDALRLAALDHRGQGPGDVLHPLLQHRRGRRVRASAPTPAATPRCSASSRSPATSSRSRRPGVQRSLPRAAGRDQPDRGHRARPAAGPGAARPPRRRGHRRDHPLHQPQHRGRGHRDVPGPAAQAARRAGSPASPAACRSAATSSTPTS